MRDRGSRVAGAVRAGGYARPRHTAFRDHGARAELALALQRGHGIGRAGDLRIADGARVRAAALPARGSGPAPGHRARIDPALFPRAPRPDRAARARVASVHPSLGGDGPLLLLPGRGTRLKGHAMRCGCWPDCVVMGSMRVCGCPARARRARGLHPRARKRSCATGDRRRDVLTRPRRQSPTPTPPPTWCCSCQGNPKPSVAPCSRHCRSDARCWGGHTVVSANCCSGGNRRARWPRSCRTPCCEPRGTCWPARRCPGYDARRPARDAAGHTCPLRAACMTGPLPAGPSSPLEAPRAPLAGAGPRSGYWLTWRCGQRPLCTSGDGGRCIGRDRTPALGSLPWRQRAADRSRLGPDQRAVFAYWLPEVASVFDAIDRAHAIHETLIDLRYLPFLWLVAAAVADRRGPPYHLHRACGDQRRGTLDALLQAATGTSRCSGASMA